MQIKSIGIIMDGNRRWAKEKGLPRAEGHKKGADTLEKIAKVVFGQGVEHLAVYAFSTENWKRSKEEVDALLKLIKFFIEKRLLKGFDDNVKFRFVGDLSLFDSSLQETIKKAEKINPQAKYCLWIALSYGGRAEMLEAARASARGHSAESEEEFKKLLWSAELPDFDLVVRTGGKRRLSNFFPWQSAYAELFFTDTLWPDFSERELLQIFNEFQSTQRNFGK